VELLLLSLHLKGWQKEIMVRKAEGTGEVSIREQLWNQQGK
jgi:hypothetical protein